MRIASWKSTISLVFPNRFSGISKMSIKSYGVFVAVSLLASTAQAQIVSGVMTVTGAEMH